MAMKAVWEWINSTASGGLCPPRPPALWFVNHRKPPKFFSVYAPVVIYNTMSYCQKLRAAKPCSQGACELWCHQNIIMMCFQCFNTFYNKSSYIWLKKAFRLGTYSSVTCLEYIICQKLHAHLPAFELLLLLKLSFCLFSRYRYLKQWWKSWKLSVPCIDACML